MNTQTQEALKMAIEAMVKAEEVFDDLGLLLIKFGVKPSDINFHKESFLAPIIQTCKEALAQPAQAITEGSQLSNIKVGSKSEKPSPPPAPRHTCTYSRTMNQEYPRKCIHCGKVEALAQPAQEPVAYEPTSQEQSVMHKAMIRSSKLVYKAHPAPSWQGLKMTEVWEIVSKLESDDDDSYSEGLHIEDFYRAIEQALKEKNYE